MQQLNLTMTGAPVQISSAGIRAGQLAIQNKGANPVYLGGSNAVNSATGLALDAGPIGGSLNWTTPTVLNSWWILGTAADVVVVLYD